MSILGQFPPDQLVRAQLETASLAVPGVTSATATLVSFVHRQLGAQVRLTFGSGQSAVIAAQALQGPLPWYVTAASPQASGSLEGGP